MGERHSLLQALMPRETVYLSPRDAFSRLPRLETPRLLLRPMVMHDAQDIYDYSRDPEVARYVLWSAHRSLSESRAYLRYILRQYRDGMPSSWGIVLKATGRVVGTIGYMTYIEENSTVEIGYSLARSLWNNGLMTEALHAVLAFSFERMQIHRVEAQHDAANPASGHVMRKCGMLHEGRLRGRVYNKGRFVDVDLYAMIREDWLQDHPTPVSSRQYE
ncbi:MAG: GNAT family N-acetyltransferase [Christensenellaceae bacterium]|nr:GNAT family N-acetyltransferase [Christensenellaceae bacterium]